MNYPYDPIALSALEELKGNSSEEWNSQVFFESMGVPLMAEDKLLAGFLQNLDQALSASHKKQLIIFFINQRENSSSEDKASNQNVLKLLSADPKKLITLINFSNHSRLIINGSLNNCELHSKEGVGRARKVLGDMALALLKQKKIESEWHRQSDADARIPRDYFSSQTTSPNSVAGIYPYQHTQGVLDEESFKALQSYENYLNVYFEGLKYAKSPYAFSAMGSCLMFSLLAYEKVRGVPNVAAGEDFYLLTKLSQLGDIESLKTTPIELLGRPSHRVPFGTGAAMKRIQDGDTIYDPFSQESFEILKKSVFELNELARHKDLKVFFDALDERAKEFFAGFANSFNKIFKHQNKEAQLRRHLHEIFDGLQTFKLLRLLNKE